MSDAPLSSLRVVVCRPAEQAGPLVRGLEAAGAEVVSAPVIRIVDPADAGTALRAAMSSLATGDWLVVTSPNGAVRASAQLPNGLPAGVQVAAIGPGTALRAAEAGLRVDLVPQRSIAEGLLEEFPAPPTGTAWHGGDTVQHRAGRVVLARAAAARAALPEGLRAAGWEVSDVPAYRTVGAVLTAEQRYQVSQADAVVFTSSSTVTRLVEQVGPESIPAVVASIGPVTTATAARHGLVVTVEAAEHTIDGVIAALCRHAASSTPS